MSDARRALVTASRLHDAHYRWRCCARRDEIQSPEIRLALSVVPADAGSSARDYCVPVRTGNGNSGEELEKVRRWNAGRELATRFFRPPLARPSRTQREDQLHPHESGSQRIVPASGGLDVGLSSERPTASPLVGRAVPCAPYLTRPKGLRRAAAVHGVMHAAVYSLMITYRHRHLIYRVRDVSGTVAYAQRHQIHASIQCAIALRP